MSKNGVVGWLQGWPARRYEQDEQEQATLAASMGAP